jgi:hypothetical protein
MSIAGCSDIAWVSARKFPTAIERKSWFCSIIWSLRPTTSPSLTKCPCQKRVIFSCSGRGLVAIMSNHQWKQAMPWLYESFDCTASSGGTVGFAFGEKSRTLSTAAPIEPPTSSATRAGRATNSVRWSRWAMSASAATARLQVSAVGRRFVGGVRAESPSDGQDVRGIGSRGRRWSARR